jgi:hypothetical protein
MRSITSLNLQARRVMDSFRDHGWLRVDVPFEELVETAAVLAALKPACASLTATDGA